MFSHLQRWLQDTERLDIVWDTSIPDSLKECAGGKKGQGVCWKGQTKLPGKWVDFFEILWTRQRYLPSWHARLKSSSGPQTRPCISHQGKLYLSLDLASPWAVVITRKQMLWLWFILSMSWRREQRLFDSGHWWHWMQPLADVWVAYGRGKKYRFYLINSICIA